MELPEKIVRELGLAEGSELSLYELRQGVYFLTRKGERILGDVSEGGLERGSAPSIGEKELAVLRKLEAIKFDQRTPKKVGEMMNEGEKKILDLLVNNNIVGFFKSAKYKEGVYSIPQNVYKIAKGIGVETGKAEAPEPAARPAVASARASQVPSNPEEALELIGYVIVEREGDAQMLSGRLAPQIKKGEIMGVRGFDKRFYLARKGFYVSSSERISKVMRGGKDKSVEEIAKEAKLKNEECEAVLNIMREEGEVVEKKRGTYALA